MQHIQCLPQDTLSYMIKWVFMQAMPPRAPRSLKSSCNNNQLIEYTKLENYAGVGSWTHFSLTDHCCYLLKRQAKYGRVRRRLRKNMANLTLRVSSLLGLPTISTKALIRLTVLRRSISIDFTTNLKRICVDANNNETKRQILLFFKGGVKKKKGN